MSIDPKSPTTVRGRLVETLRRDLIGPNLNDIDIADEKLDTNPSRWYLTGFLVPAPTDGVDEVDQPEETGDMVTDGEEQGDPETGNARAADDTAPDDPAPRRPLAPSACGLTVLVDARAETVDVTATWGDYVTEPPLPPEVFLDDAAAFDPKHRNVAWQRIPGMARVTIAVPRPGERITRTLEGSAGKQRPGGGLVVEAFARPYSLTKPDGSKADVVALTVMLVNRRDPTRRRFADVTFAFQVKLEVRSELPLFPRTDMTGFGSDDPDAATADLHYHDVAEYAVGNATSAGWMIDQDSVVRAAHTDFLPLAEVERVEPNESIGATFGMDDLAKLAAGDPDVLVAALSGLPREYANWIDAEAGDVRNIDGEPRRRTAERLLEAARRAQGRIEAGIALLKKDKWARLAFQAMNEAVARAARQRTAGRNGDPAAQKQPTWRPFQLAFVLLNLPGLNDKLHEDREIVDLLFFPTGGGKTEAYLGLAAWTIAHRRLTADGKLGAGVSVLMRYTLRLLTLDQLSRAAGVVCALELMRGEPAWMEGTQRLLGDWPIEIGLWVGAAASPNRLGGKGNPNPDTAVIRVKRFKTSGREAPAPIKACPWCAEPFTADSFACTPNAIAPKNMEIRCTNADCDFTGGRALPILTVDEAIYRRLPAFVIATVDKFAGLPWLGEAGAFFGHVNRTDEWGFYGANDKAGDGRPLGNGFTLDPPDLIIQDELHLISGPLGTVAALYEVALDRLASRTMMGRRVRPKIVASTATVRRASAQIKALFDRETTEIFPPPGPDRRDSFFAETVPPTKRPARLYLGLAAPGKGPKLVFLRTLTTLLAAAQKEADEGNDADPYMTALGYFNALRELGGARRIVEDEVRSYLSDYGDKRRRVAPPDQPFASRRMRDVLELTSRESTDKVAAAKDSLAVAAADKAGVDVALATNMISVGLDIGRLGLMLMQGQPKSASEYIQASSRVGRLPDKPGLVVTLLNAQKPRDRLHFERFRQFHAAFYRVVEPTSVTPWAARAIDRALAAVIVACVRHLHPELTDERNAVEMPDHVLVPEIVDVILSRAPSESVVGGHAALKTIVEELLTTWRRIADDRRGNAERLYYGYPGTQALLHQPLDPLLAGLDPDLKAFKAGRSMRDVEHASILKIIDNFGNTLS
ncbi:DISARM system helicase DrmA [Agrobacterium tumefaciens]|uniref:DISARM system helicase DrmA n=1 Tax=Agrobacterium tumefaciens TaxID=358 RepID=UPI002B0001F6|nr:DISARM system helicase DrmA [Agrobacterium tumefaciens]MEA1842962.1 DISARM system helicase DrmA [Agrobacterium tumefaciens]